MNQTKNPKTRNRPTQNRILNHLKVPLVFLFAGILFGSLFTAFVLSQSSGTFTITEGIFPTPYDYIVYLDGSTYRAKNSWGVNAYSSANKTEVIANAYASLSSGTIALKGMLLSPSINLSKTTVFIYEIYEGETTIYPFPYNLGGSDFPFYDADIYFTGSRGYLNGWLTFKYNKDLWCKSETAEHGIDFCRQSTISQKLFHFGTYQFRYYHTGNESDKAFGVGFFPSGMCTLGTVCFTQLYDGKELATLTSYAGSTTEINLTPAQWNPNVDSLLSFTWNATAVKFYVNGVLVSTHTTNIPQQRIPFAMEICHEHRTSNFAYDTWAYVKGFRRVG